MVTKNCKRSLLTTTMTILALFIPILLHPAQAKEPPTANDLAHLKELIAKHEELEAKLEATIKAAEEADPNLLKFKQARDKWERWYNDLGPEKQKWIQWKIKQDDPKKAEYHITRLKNLAGFFADDLDDPNLGPFIRYTMLPILIKGAKDPNTIVGPYTSPNEPDEEKLWEGFKKYRIEEASYRKEYLDKYVKENNIPDWLVQLAANMSRGETYLMYYRIAIGQHMPKEIPEIEKQKLNLSKELAKVLPQWNQLRNLPEDKWEKFLEQSEIK